MVKKSAGPTAYLRVSKATPGIEKEYALMGEVITIGRHQSNSISLPLEAISRFHAKIQMVKDKYIVTDMKSSNGVFVNGERIKSAQLSERDVVSFGNIAFNFSTKASPLPGTKEKRSRESESSIELVATELPPSSTVIRTEEKSDSSEITGAVLTAKGKRELLRLNRRLVTLYKVSEILRQSANEAEVLTKILDLIFEVISAERGVVFYNQSGTSRFEDFEPISIKFRDEPISRQGVPVSRTILEKSILERVAILSRDPRSDSRFDSSESIILHDIQATICVPMVSHDRILGILHIDGKATNESFNDDDLAFLTTLSNEVAMNLENQRMQREMTQKERLAAVGQTIMGIAHNIKNILLLAQGGFELVEKAIERNDLETARSSFGVAKRGVVKITNLVKDMLDYSRSQRVKLEKGDVNKIISDVIDIVKEEMSKKGVDLQVNLEQDLPEVLLDEQGLHRAVENILINATEAIEHGQGVLDVSSFMDEKGSLFIRIEDNGKGIPEEYLQKIFEPFFTTKGSKGTGLGLAMTKKVIEDMGGKIFVESTEGEGTTFIIEIPTTTTTRIGDSHESSD